MQDTIEVLNNDLAYSLFKNMQTDNLEYTYRGNFNSAIAENILTLAENNFTDIKETIKIRKRVYFIMVECLQNITRHQEEKPENFFQDSYGLFVIRRKKYAYYITTGNLIKNDSIKNITSRIEKINSMDIETLKNYSREILKEGNVSNKGGAGLGFIEMARKSGKKLKYNFLKRNDEYSYFYLHMCVPIDQSKNEESDFEYKEYSETTMLKLHNTLITNNIVLNFSGMLNQSNFTNLLNILSLQISISKQLKTKVYSVMTELLHNVLPHADKHTEDQSEDIFGLFYIKEEKNALILTSGNFVKSDKIDCMKQMLEKINNSDLTQRKQLEQLADPKISGFITIRNISENKYSYKFTKSENNFSFFSISIKFNKTDNQ